MRPFGVWFGRLAVAGSCLAWVGCGGGDVPDPDSDSTAANDAPAQVVDRGGPQAPAEAPAAEPTRPAAPAVPGAEQPAAVATAPPAAEPETPAPASEPEKAASTTKGDASGTEDMLRIASNPTPDAPAGGAPPAAGNPAAPGFGGGPPPGSPMAAMAASMANRPGMGNPAGMPGAPGGGRGRDGEVTTPSGPPGFPQGIPGAPGAPGAQGSIPGMPVGMPPGMMAGGPGGFRGPGSPGSPDATPVGPDTFNHADTAVQAFLSALKLKDRDRLTQATARRAPTEAAEKHRKIFQEIVEGSISDDELDEMSKAMEGYQVGRILPAQSSGRFNVVISRREGPDMKQRTVIVRKEQNLWKVLDIGGELNFKAQGIFRGRR